MSIFHPLKGSIIFLLATLFLPAYARAQNTGISRTDSLRNALTLHGGNDQGRVDILNALSSEYAKVLRNDSARYYAEAALRSAGELDDRRGMAAACRHMAVLALRLKDTLQAERYFHKAWTVAEEGRDWREMIPALRGLASLHEGDYLKSSGYYQRALAIAQQRDLDTESAEICLDMARLSLSFARYPEALGRLRQSLDISRRSGNRKMEAAALFELGVFYNNLDESARAIDYIKRSLILNRQLENKKEEAKSLGMLGAIYMNGSEYDKSLQCYTLCIEILKDIREKTGLASVYANVAFLYQLMSDYSTALEYHKRSLALSTELGYRTGALLYYKDMGRLIQKAPDSLLRKMGIAPRRRYATAVEYGVRALDLARALNDPIQKKYVWQILIPAYEKTGNDKAAYLNLKRLNALSDSISDQQKQKQIIQKEVEFDFEQKAAASRAAREREGLKQRAIRNSLLAGLILLAVFSVIVLRQRNHTRKAQARAEQSEKQKQRFFANISHEFRTPLTLLIGPMEDFMRGEDPEQFKAMLPTMHRHATRLLNLINQLLDLSRLDAEKYKINTTRTDILPFIHQLVHAFSSLAQSKKIDLETSVDQRLRACLDEADLSFHFDGDVLEKIVINLLANAFKYTPSGGRILVWLGLPENNRGFLELKIEDNGIGIPRHLLPYIFDRFYQVERKDSPLAGSGIGLSLIKELMDLHGGKILVQSEEGKGTAFSCLFPLNKKIVHAAGRPAHEGKEIILPPEEVRTGEAPVAPGPANDGRPVILVIEDQQDLRKYICSKLKDQYAVREAENGEQGLFLAKELIPDLVISDVMMPVKDGFALTTALKKDNLTSHIPIILLTARADDGDKMTGLGTGADAYMVKPFHSGELLIRVKNLILLRNKMRAKFSGNVIVKPAEIAATPLDQVFMEQLLSAVEAHIGDRQFTVADLGKAVNMSTSQLNRKLNAIINCSATQFIRSVRLQRAMDMLRHEAGTISEIAFQVGFETPSYFTKMFKAQFGCLPSEKEKFPGNA